MHLRTLACRIPSSTANVSRDTFQKVSPLAPSSLSLFLSHTAWNGTTNASIVRSLAVSRKGAPVSECIPQLAKCITGLARLRTRRLIELHRHEYLLHEEKIKRGKKRKKGSAITSESDVNARRIRATRLKRRVIVRIRRCSQPAIKCSWHASGVSSQPQLQSMARVYKRYA